MIVLTGMIALILGVVAGLGGFVYLNLPNTDKLIIGEDIVYSYNNSDEVNKIELTGADGEFSVHFLELGNKYTGDCTYIKYKDIDILIDCGSRANSISTVANYLNQYVADNKLEYVIVTHAHTDHYAGFATSTKIKSIFDLYECETIIDFGNATNQTTGSTYKNYLRELNDEIDKGAKHYSAIDCYNNENGASREFILDNEKNIKFEILLNEYQKYDNSLNNETFKAKTENDYSVCTLFSYGERNFLFTGDLEAEGEQKLVENNSVFTELKNNGNQYGVELYKAGHHGSKTSSSQYLLECVRPEYVCVCCCAGSSEYTKTVDNQFPTQQFIDRISVYTDKVYVTTVCLDYQADNFSSMNGNIVIVVTELTIGINCSNNTTKLKDSEWFNKIIVDEKGVSRPNRVWQN